MKFETTANLSQKSIENLIKDIKNYSKEFKESKKRRYFIAGVI